MSEEFEAYRDDFLVEADEILSRLSATLVELEQAGGDVELLHQVYRDMHSYKGMAGMMGFQVPQDLAHAAEDVLDLLREETLQPTPEIVDVLLAALDRLGEMTEDIRQGGAGQLESEELVSRLRAIHKGGGAKAEEEAGAGPVAAEATTQAETRSRPGTKSGTRRAVPGEGSPEGTVRVGVRRLDQLLDLVGEVVVCRNRITVVARRLQTGVREGVAAMVDPLTRQATGDRRPVAGALAGSVDDLIEVVGSFNRLVGDLQVSVLAIRMLPVSSVLGRFPRYVRDLARTLGKACEVQIEGADTELDRAVLELLKDPLVHIVRNAVDHGIEPPASREEAGKNPTGLLRIVARPQEGSIILEVSDDGAGISRERIQAAAEARGLIPAGGGKTLSHEEVVNLVLEPGFSTATSVTDLSGRGVGLDVVKSSLEEIGGHIEIESTEGQGTRFLIKLPLTLAIMKTLQVRVGDEVYSVPLPAVVESMRITSRDLREAAGRRVQVVRGEVLPVLSLSDVFGITPRPGRFQHSVTVAFGGRRAALLVDGLEGQQEVVIKPLGGYLRGGCPGISGATVLGDGRVMLILDVGALLDLATRGEYGMEHGSEGPA